MFEWTASQARMDWSASGLASAIEANQIGFLADLGRSPQVELHQDPDVTWFVIGLGAPGFNRILSARFDAGDVQARIEAALAHFKSRQLPMTWHTGPSTRPLDLGQRLLEHGLTHAGDEPGMAIDLRALPVELHPPPGLKIVPVGDLESLGHWCNTLVHGFGWSGWMADAMVRVEASLGLGQPGHRRLYVGYLREVPVGTALLFLEAGVAGLYSVATVPEARGQGIGQAMTLRPLLDACAMGYRIGTLNASTMGFNIYARLGFQEYCQLGRYLWTGEGGLGMGGDE